LLSAEAFWERHRAGRLAGGTHIDPARGHLLLAAEYCAQRMYTSCGFFFEELDRIEPRNNIAFARRAINLVWQATGEDLQAQFLTDLAAVHSRRTGVSGLDIYRQLPRIRYQNATDAGYHLPAATCRGVMIERAYSPAAPHT
jgi:Domain of unknown function (DUF3536)